MLQLRGKLLLISELETPSTLIVILLHFMAKHFRRQDTKMNFSQRFSFVSLCLSGRFFRL